MPRPTPAMTAEVEMNLYIQDWKRLNDDDKIVRSASMKGKYLFQAFILLAERQKTDKHQAKKFFYTKALEYIDDLLTQQHIGRADHVLTNIGFTTKRVFFQVAKEHRDQNVRDALLVHCRRTYDDFENACLKLEQELILFNKLKYKSEHLVEHFGRTLGIHEFDLMFFDPFCKIKPDVKQKMVVYIFFRDQGE